MQVQVHKNLKSKGRNKNTFAINSDENTSGRVVLKDIHVRVPEKNSNL